MATTADLLSPDGATLTDPGQVERALADMWKSSGKAASGDEQAAATRVCVANLVVVAAEERWNELLEVLGELSPMYPTRTIALLLSKDGAAACSPASGSPQDAERVRAAVSALCHVPQPGQPQVCCEQILLHATQAQSADLHRTILPLLEADVPVMVWWTLPPADCSELLESMAAHARRFLLDAGLSGLSLLSFLTFPGVRELGWYRIHRWRELVASIFDECGGRPLGEMDEVAVEIGSDDPGIFESALWLIAFLGGQLGWELTSAEGKPTAKAPEPGVLEPRGSFTFEMQGRPVRASISQSCGHGLVGLTMRAGKNLFEARRGEEELRIIAHEDHVCQVPRVVHLPRRRHSEALATALAGRAVDAAFTRASVLVAAMASSVQQGSK